MAKLILDDLEDDVFEKLSFWADVHNHTVEDEARRILGKAVADRGGPKLGSRIAARFAGAELDFNIPEIRGQEARPAEIEP